MVKFKRPIMSEVKNLLIAVCDDNEKDLKYISEILDSYRRETRVGLAYKLFTDSSQLIDSLHKESFDVLLLDVLMPLVNGVQLAREIRKFDENIKIVFLTSSPEYAIDSYSVNALHYILKPINRNQLYPLLYRVDQMLQKREDHFFIRLQNAAITISYSKLSYLEVMNKKLCFHMSDGEVKSLTAPLCEYETLFLTRKEFVRVHRAFIVNVLHIHELNSSSIITFNGDVIPVARRQYKQVRDVYFECMFVEKG